MHHAASRTKTGSTESPFDDGSPRAPSREAREDEEAIALRSGALDEGNSSLRTFRMATSKTPSQTIVTICTAVTLSLPNSLKIST
jgi:hypothetical protein